MKYQMIVKITDPDTPKGMFSELTFKFNCYLSYDPKQYGNGYYLRIENKGYNTFDFDLRYDRSFNSNKPEEWLKSWANNYWSGKNGAWKIKRLLIEKID